MEETLKQGNSNCLKIVLFGPESSGKTTLAKQLATHYKTHWVPEYMREYLQKKGDLKNKKCTKKDLMPIAEGQMSIENSIAKTVDELLFCDTNLLELKVYSKYYYDGYCPSEIEEYALKNSYDCYLLTYIDTPWELDDLRDRPNDREKMFRIFESELLINKLHFEVLKGAQDVRFEKAVRIIEELLKQKKNAIN